jgi:hypothetical protein
MIARTTLSIGLVFALHAHASARTYQAFLDGAQEWPVQVMTAGSGYGRVTAPPVGVPLLDVEITFSNLTTPTTGASLHCCITPQERRSGIAVNFLSGWPIGTTSGNFSLSYDLSDASLYSSTFRMNHGGTAASARQALVDGLYAGQAYLNIRSSFFPSGEIRGDLRLVLSADFDDDNDVDGADFLIWQRHAVGPGSPNLGDATQNGIVDAADLFLWAFEFGDVVHATSSAIPEPGTASSLAAVGVAIGCRRRWRQICARANGRC